MIEDSGRAKRFHRKTSKVLTEINVTPFVDVMLVLLIIFMVTAPLLTSGIKIDLPKEEAGGLEIGDSNVVVVRKDGAIFINDKRVNEDELFRKMKTISATSTMAEVFLMADKALAYGDVINVMGIIKTAGVEKLGMVTDVPPKGKGG